LASSFFLDWLELIGFDTNINAAYGENAILMVESAVKNPG
jgi:hypothetical protein